MHAYFSLFKLYIASFYNLKTMKKIISMWQLNRINIFIFIYDHQLAVGDYNIYKYIDFLLTKYIYACVKKKIERANEREKIYIFI